MTAKSQENSANWMFLSNYRRNQTTADLEYLSAPAFKQPLLPSNENILSSERHSSDNNDIFKSNLQKRGLGNELRITPNTKNTAPLDNVTNFEAQKSLRQYRSTPNFKDLMLSTETNIPMAAKSQENSANWMFRSNCTENRTASDLEYPFTPVFKQPHLPANENIVSSQRLSTDNNGVFKSNIQKRSFGSELRITPSTKNTAPLENVSNFGALKSLRQYHSTPNCKDLMLSTDGKLNAEGSALKASRLSGLSWEERSRVIGLPRRVQKTEVEEDDSDDDDVDDDKSKVSEANTVVATEDSLSSFCPLKFNTPHLSLNNENFHKNLERRKVNADDNSSYIKTNNHHVTLDNSPANKENQFFRSHSLKEISSPIQKPINLSEISNNNNSPLNRASSLSLPKIPQISNESASMQIEKENGYISHEKQGSSRKAVQNNKHPRNILEVNGNSYSVLNQLGQGASSVVFQVFDIQKKITLAIKCVNLENANEEMTSGFKQEITLLKKLQDSDKVVKLIDFEQKGNKLYIVMERGDTSMRDVLRDQTKQGQIPGETIKYYWAEMLRAVAVIHKAGIIHCDLKPANFLLVKGKIKLIDFGIASSIQPDMTSVELDSVGGTPNFMSPEAACIFLQVPTTTDTGMVDWKKKMNAKADVWSLGCILYSLVYGKPPFDNIKPDLRKIHAITKPECKILFPPIADQLLLDVMKKCLTRDPKLRPSIDELLAHPYLITLEASEKEAEQPVPIMSSLFQQLQNLTPRRIQQVSKFLKQMISRPDGNN